MPGRAVRDSWERRRTSEVEGREMPMRTPAVSCACAGAAVILCAAAQAPAQLVFGTTTPTTTNPSAVYLDVNTGTTTVLWNSAANKKVNGAAADLAGRRLYTNDAA